jgi:hypothetical protein
MRKIYISTPVNPEDVILNMTDSLNRDELFDLICLIDDTLEDYDFTERLYNHFKKVIEEEFVDNESN